MLIIILELEEYTIESEIIILIIIILIGQEQDMKKVLKNIV